MGKWILAETREYKNGPTVTSYFMRRGWLGFCEYTSKTDDAKVFPTKREAMTFARENLRGKHTAVKL